MARYSNQRQYEFDEMHANDNDGERRSNYGNYNRGSRYEDDDMRYGRSSGDSRRGFSENRDYSERYGRPETRNFDYDDEMNYGGRDRQEFGYGQSFGGDDYGTEYGSPYRGSRGYGRGGQGMRGRGSYGSYEEDYDDSMSSSGAYGGNAGRSGSRQYSRSGYGDYNRGYGSDEDMNYGGSPGRYGEHRSDDDWDRKPRRSRHW